ncbi:FMN-binding protein [Proteinivorax tanatarense]|uniref:FMN-binding protein n=1 Tax=Proteinivorax tanatarense TaxID=1260629 RepID=A0AAU7VIT9_9FIRM
MKKFLVLVGISLFILCLIACSPGGDTAVEGQYTDGTYSGTGQGYGGEIRVEVIIENGLIQAVNVEEHSESEGVADPALEQIPPAIVEEQNTEVDNVSGATETSVGIKDAVDDALEDAR